MIKLHLWFVLSDNLATTVPVGEECVITVNASEAGPGNLTCRISTAGDSDVDIDIVDNGDGTISIVYTPRAPGAYQINIKFGGQPVPNGNFTQKVNLNLITIKSSQRQRLKVLHV